MHLAASCMQTSGQNRRVLPDRRAANGGLVPRPSLPRGKRERGHPFQALRAVAHVSTPLL
eukprot:3885878-Amphidinium_carterae.2